jgi:hypothetical protein
MTKTLHYVVCGVNDIIAIPLAVLFVINGLRAEKTFSATSKFFALTDLAAEGVAHATSVQSPYWPLGIRHRKAAYQRFRFYERDLSSVLERVASGWNRARCHPGESRGLGLGDPL